MKFTYYLIACLSLSVCFSTSLSAQELVPSETMALVTVVVHPDGQPNAVGETVSFKSQKTGVSKTVVTGADAKAQLLLAEGDVYDISYKDFFVNQDYTSMEIPSQPGITRFEVEVIYMPAKVFRLDNVYFDFAKASLRTESFPALDNLAECLKAKPKMIVEIGGHTDDVGDDASNMTLSQQRAESVRNYLMKKGIAANRVIAKGYGETQPVTTGTSDQDRQMNRRTEVKILSQ